MKLNKMFKIYLLMILCLFVSSQIVFAAGIKERMKARLPVIAQLKAKGIIGENNQGYLGFVSGARENEAIVAAENKDRKAIYSYFAKQQNTKVDVVEQVQAKRKAERAKTGEFIQKPDGSWIRK